ncbi:ectoine/hydroxyectoine ABC transporter substrate-binding protein EhuB [Bradyrhizobium sp. 23AC]
MDNKRPAPQGRPQCIDLVAQFNRRGILRGAAAAMAITAVARSKIASAEGAVAANPNSTLGKAIASKSIKVGIAGLAGFGYLGADGKPTGIDVDVLRACMQSLGITNLEPVQTAFGSLIPGLNAGQFDVVAAGLAITKQRCSQVAFGDPAAWIGGAFIVRKGNPKKLHSWADVVRTEAIFAVGTGSSDINMAKALGIPDSRILQFQQFGSAAAVAAGRADFTSAGKLVQVEYLKNNPNPNLEIVDADPVDASGNTIKYHSAVAFRPQDTDFRDAYNKELAKLKSSGQLLVLLGKYGLGENEVPKTTAAALCN